MKKRMLAFSAIFVLLISAAKAQRPNILFILADDLGYGDVGCYNANSKIPTPHLDRLATQGMRFTDAHAPASVCSPTRYALLTGRYAWRSRLQRGVLAPWDKPLIEYGRLTVGSLLRQHGYVTACIGKWHLGWSWPTQDGKPPTVGSNRLSNVAFMHPIAIVAHNRRGLQRSVHRPPHGGGLVRKAASAGVGTLPKRDRSRLAADSRAVHPGARRWETINQNGS